MGGGIPRRHRVAQEIECFVPDPIVDWDPTWWDGPAEGLSYAGSDSGSGLPRHRALGIPR